MEDTNEVFVFDIDFPKQKLLEEWHNVYLKDSEGYTDKRYNKPPAEWWRVARLTSHDYSTEICDKLGVYGKPRFYLLEKNATLPFHVDLGTMCSINFIVSDGEGAPVTFETTGNQYTYKSALLNTSLSHGVTNIGADRILFKISFMENNFEDIKERIRNRLTK